MTQATIAGIKREVAGPEPTAPLSCLKVQLSAGASGDEVDWLPPAPGWCPLRRVVVTTSQAKVARPLGLTLRTDSL